MMRDKKEHRVLAVKEFQDKDYEDVLKRPVFCSKERHQKEELKYYCKECETTLCQSCVTLNHGDHDLRLIEEEAENKTLEIKSILQSHREGLDAKLNVIVQLDEDCAKVIQQSEIARRDVQRFADGLIKTIQAKMQNIITAVENQTKKSLESLKAKRSAIQEQINATKSSLEEADKLLKRSTTAEVVQLKKSLQTIFQGLNQTERPIVHDPSSLQTLVFAENQNILDTVIREKLGFLCMEEGYRKKPSELLAEGKGLKEGTVGCRAQFNLITRNAERKQWYNEHERVKVEIKDEQERECVTQVKIDDSKNGIYKITYFPIVQGTFKLLVKVNGEHISCSPFTVILKPFQVKPVLSFGKKGSGDGMFKFPLGVAVGDGDEIVVADQLNYRVQLFDSNGTFLRSFGHKGKNDGEFNYPAGIVINKDRQIFVADRYNHRIQIFSWEGRHLDSFGGKGSLDSQLSDPRGLSLDSTGNIIVADSSNKLIKIFTPDGRFIMKIGGQGSFSFPVYCVQCGEYFIVSDSSEHCIKVFNREGHFQYKFGKKGEGDGDFNCPRFLSVTKSKHLLVCDEDSHRIQVFELDGKFVGKFGTNGSKLGEFNCPFSVAVLSNEQIIVCERGNHRIQIFQ